MHMYLLLIRILIVKYIRLLNLDAKKIVQEKFIGTNRERQVLAKLFDVIRKGDTVVVESISRLGHKTLDILNII